MTPELEKFEKEMMDLHKVNPNELTEYMSLMLEYKNTVKEMADKLKVITDKIVKHKEKLM